MIGQCSSKLMLMPSTSWRNGDRISGHLVGDNEKSEKWHPTIKTRDVPIHPGSTYSINVLVRNCSDGKWIQTHKLATFFLPDRKTSQPPSSLTNRFGQLLVRALGEPAEVTINNHLNISWQDIQDLFQEPKCDFREQSFPRREKKVWPKPVPKKWNFTRPVFFLFGRFRRNPSKPNETFRHRSRLGRALKRGGDQLLAEQLLWLLQLKWSTFGKNVHLAVYVP